MANSPILNIPAVAASQNTKEVTINTATNLLEAAFNDFLDVDMTSADVTLTAAQYRAAMRFRCINVTTARVLTLQAIKREVTIRSSSANTAAVTITLGTTTITIYPGQSLKVYTNGTANGLEVVAQSNFEPPVTYTADHTLSLVDRGCLINMNKATAITLTVPPNSSVAFDIGDRFEAHQGGAGQVTLSPGAGVTIQTARSLTSRAQWSKMVLHKIATDTWLASGDLT